MLARSEGCLEVTNSTLHPAAVKALWYHPHTPHIPTRSPGWGVTQEISAACMPFPSSLPSDSAASPLPPSTEPRKWS